MDSHFNGFSNTIRYEDRKPVRKAIKDEVKAINNKKLTYSQAFTGESILKLKRFETVIHDKSQLISELTKIHTNFIDYPRVDQQERIVLERAKNALGVVTFASTTESDHFLLFVSLKKPRRFYLCAAKKKNEHTSREALKKTREGGSL